MYELQTFGIFLIQIDAGNATVIDLSPKFAEVGAALVPHPSLREEPATIACLEDTDREIDVLSKAHLAESAQTHVSITAYAHIERTGIKLIELLFSTANAACREKTCHGVRNGDRKSTRLNSSHANISYAVFCLK